MILLFKYFILIVVFSQLFSTVFCVQNILLIVVDDLRPALGCYNDKNAYTPHIDELAANSYVFTRAFAQQALCAPSRNSFLTSRRPDSLRLYDFYSYWRHVVGNFTTLPQFFKERGYVTKSIGKVFHPGISSNNSDDQPYSWSEPPYHPATERYKEWPVCGAGHRNLVCPVNTDLQPGGTLPDLQSVAEAKRFVASRAEAKRSASSRPFLLAVGFHKPHVPLKFPKRFLDYHPLENVTLPDNRQRPYGSPTVAWNPWNDLRERDDIAKLKLLFPFQPMPVDWMKRIIQSYNAAVTYVDELIGELLLTLENEGFDNNTIVALIGDHGWSLGEHGEWSKFSNYEVATRVPFILKVPQLQQKGKQLNQEQKKQDLWIQKRKSEQGLLTGQKKLKQQKQEQQSKEQEKKWRMRNELVELVDLFPTLVELAGFKPLERCSTGEKQQMLCTEGNSLVPLLLQENSVNPTTAKWKRAAFSQYPRPGLYPTLKPNSDRPRLSDIAVMGYTMRTDRYRYTEWVRFKPKDSILSTTSNRSSIHEKISNGSSDPEVVSSIHEKTSNGSSDPEVVSSIHEKTSNSSSDPEVVSSIHEKTSNGSSDPKVVSSIHEKTSNSSSDPEVVSSIHEKTSNGPSDPEVVSSIHEKTSNSSSSPEVVFNESLAPEVASNGSSFSEVTPDWSSTPQVTPDWSTVRQVTPDWSTVRQVTHDWFSAHQVPSDWSTASKMSSDWSSTPVMSSDWSSAAKMSSDWSSTPEMSPDWSSTPVMSSDWSSTPVMSSDWSSTPVMSSDWSSTPVMSSDWSSTPEMSSDWSSAAKLGPDWSVVYACELYDHTIDSEESVNLADRPQLAALRRQLSEQLRRGWRGSQ